MEPNNIKYNQEDLELIDAYFLGNLDSDELAEFKERKRKYPKFTQLVKEQKDLIDGIEEISLKNKLDDFHESAESSSDGNWRSRGKWALAASLLVLISVCGWALLDRNSADRVFATNFKPDPGLPTTMGAYSNYDFYYGMVNYKRKEYAEAISKWEPLYAANAQNDTLTYFLGVANLANGNSRQAEKYLQLAKKDTGSIFSEEIRFYLALALLKKHNIAEAKTVLNGNNFPANIALLKDLESL